MTLSLSHHAVNVLLDYQETLEPQETTATPDHLDSPVAQETMAHQDLPAHKDHPDHPESQVVTVPVETQDAQLFQHLHCLEIPDNLEIKDHLDCLESPDNLDVTANLDPLDPKDLLVHPDNPAHLDPPENRDLKDHPDNKANAVFARNIAHWMAVSSSKMEPDVPRNINPSDFVSYYINDTNSTLLFFFVAIVLTTS